jgi:hypothetical protein
LGGQIAIHQDYLRVTKKEDRSEHSQSVASATSSGLPGRPHRLHHPHASLTVRSKTDHSIKPSACKAREWIAPGIMADTRNDFAARLAIGVSIKPGQTALMRIPLLAYFI